MKYKVGDKVKIREDLIVNTDYGVDTFEPEMAEFKGQVATIVKVKKDTYAINLDTYAWNWTDEMFENEIDVTKLKDDANEQTVDIGYNLKYCGHRVIKNVYYGGYAHDHDHVFCTTVDGKNQYTLPVNSIEFIIPHED